MPRISDAELEVMKVIWEEREVTSLEIIKRLKYCNWGDNTIRTLINRLVSKKAVGISKKEGKTYFYVPLIKKSAYRDKQMGKFIKQFFNNSFSEFLKFIFQKYSVNKKRKRYFMKKYKGKSNMVGSLIKRKREEIGMSTSDVCQKLKTIGVSINKNELYRIEKEQMMLKDFEMVALCFILEIDSNEFKEIISYKK